MFSCGRYFKIFMNHKKKVMWDNKFYKKSCIQIYIIKKKLFPGFIYVFCVIEMNKIGENLFNYVYDKSFGLNNKAYAYRNEKS